MILMLFFTKIALLRIFFTKTHLHGNFSPLPMDVSRFIHFYDQDFLNLETIHSNFIGTQPGESHPGRPGVTCDHAHHPLCSWSSGGQPPSYFSFILFLAHFHLNSKLSEGRPRFRFTYHLSAVEGRALAQNRHLMLRSKSMSGSLSRHFSGNSGNATKEI